MTADVLSADRYEVQPEPTALKCAEPKCGGTNLVFSEDQSPCIFTLISADHGQQDWYECPDCGCIWESSELDSDWRCESINGL